MVCTGSDGHQIVRESLDTVWAYGVGTNHHGEIVSFEEGIQVIRAEVHNVILLLWISHVVVLETILLFCLVRITPKKVKYLLMIL